MGLLRDQRVGVDKNTKYMVEAIAFNYGFVLAWNLRFTFTTSVDLQIKHIVAE